MNSFFLGFEKRAYSAEDYLGQWEMNHRIRNSPFSEQAKGGVRKEHTGRSRKRGAHIGALSGALVGAGARGLKGALIGAVGGTLLGGGAGDIYARATQQSKVNEATKKARKRLKTWRADEIPIMKLPVEKRKRLATTFAKIDAKHNDEAFRNARKEVAVHRATR